PFLHRLVSFGDFIDSMERSDSHPRCGELWLSLVRRPHRRPPVDADGSHRFRNAPFGRDVVQAPGGASGLSHDETRCAAFAGAGASSASATCRFRESIPHPVQPLSTLRTPRRRDACKTRSRPACSALNGPDLHWQAHSSFPLAPRTALSCLLRLEAYAAYPCRSGFRAGRTTRTSEFGTAVPSTPPRPAEALSVPDSQNFQDVSAFALTYILRLRSCKSMDAFVISSLPSLWPETLQTAGPLRSTDFTPLHGYCGPIRHPLAFDRLPG